MECSLCPKNTYAPGNIYRLNGEYLGFNNQTFNLTSSNCYIQINNSLIQNNQCKAWSIEDDGSYLKTNDADIKNYSGVYISSFLIAKNILKEGKLRVLYEKERIPIDETVQAAKFVIYINHSKAFEDFFFTPKTSEVEIELTQGFNSILFEYQKNAFQSNDYSNSSHLSMRILSIEISGIDNLNSQCIPCFKGYSKEGSDRCFYCFKGEYFNIETEKCIKCPLGKTTYSRMTLNSSSCVSIRECNETSYSKNISSLCHIKTNKQFVYYTLKDQDCIETPSVASFKQKKVECSLCKIGQFKYRIDEEYTKCTDCPQGTYSYQTNSPHCSLCKNGIISKITYYTHQTLSNQTIINETIEESIGELIIDYSLIDQSSQSPLTSAHIHVAIDSLPMITITESGQIVKLDKGNHTITITNNNNAIINTISITNTKNGIGYKCSNNKATNCPPGTEYNEQSFKCDQCPIHKYNAHFGGKCSSCPIYSSPSKQNKQCAIGQILSYPPSNLLFDLSALKSLAASLCKMNQNMCYSNNYYGPLTSTIDPHSYFFISMNDTSVFNSPLSNIQNGKNNINTSIPSLLRRFPIDLSSVDPGFLYRTNTISNFTFESITNLGSEVESIMLLNEPNDKGIIIKFSNGDECDSGNLKRYQSFIYVKCQNELYQTNQLRLINKNSTTCSYFFEYSSRIGCPICNTTQIKQIKSNCNKNTKTVFNTIKLNQECILSNMTDKSISESDYNSVLLKNGNSDLIEVYNITIGNSSNTNGNDNDNSNGGMEEDDIIFVNNNEIEINCFDHNEFYIAMVIIAFGIFFVLIIMSIVLYRKYSKLNKEYILLNETQKTLTKEPNNIDINEKQDKTTHNTSMELK